MTSSADPQSIAVPANLQSMACLGGGHGLFQTLRAARLLAVPDITAIVTVADDGGSSGRIRRELGHIPPGDLRMALAALSREDDRGRMWEELLQHRFGGSGALAGHAVGNLLIAGLTDILGSQVRALDVVAELTNSHGRVVPMCEQPLDIEAEVAGLADDPRIMRMLRGQVAVATTPGEVRRVRLMPEHPEAGPDALDAVQRADLITLGPGSWFSSVIPHLLVPQLVEAISAAEARRVVIMNLSNTQLETTGFSPERHVHMLLQHAPALRVDQLLVDSAAQIDSTERRHLERAAQQLGAEVVYADVRYVDQDGRSTDRHCPAKLAHALSALLS
ncbi:gluconeogenesis factor YvcK family protein [Corynebacterium epidermidicanis]|uniref:Putative gluconeogenesis factor n=1 Tax=Corynebacterium epidermidicanis TaxID=1050174 RepID=A0A0G3GPY9_9CORY|nr:uridine diphosphate-N-acetylglucosamine-binding protein YvcK [Corynebacterium epidermidicanis]AKK03214.1 cofD-related protein [Corynebacterium epidermidicanis]